MGNNLVYHIPYIDTHENVNNKLSDCRYINEIGDLSCAFFSLLRKLEWKIKSIQSGVR